MAWRHKYIAPSGREWRLIDEDPNGVFIVEGNLPNLTATVAEQVMSVPGRSGQVLRGDSAFQPMTASMQVCVNGGLVGRSNSEVLEEWSRDWSRVRNGRYVIESDEGIGTVWCEVRLSGGGWSEPAVTTVDDVEHFLLNASIVSDSCRWLWDMSYRGGNVTVTNTGIDYLIPRIQWTTGGEVILPSGAHFTLPTVSEARILNLDNWSGFKVTDLNGIKDEALTRQLGGSVFEEGVPAGEERSFTIPDDALLLAQIGLEDHWR